MTEQLSMPGIAGPTFEMTVERASVTPVTQEVVERNAVAASSIAEQFFAESAAALGPDAGRVDRMLVELVNRVHVWVAQRRAGHAGLQPVPGSGA